MISVDALILAAVCLASAAFGLTIAWLTRDITFFGAHTDNEKHARAAARLKLRGWPSQMHKGTEGRAAMKAFFVLLLAVVQRVLRDRTSERPLVVLCIVANSFSAVLMFPIARTYWDINVAMLVVALFLTCLWPWLCALYGGPICLAQTCFLASVYFMQLAETGSPAFGLVCYGIAGVAVGLTQVSSGSARKYLPLSAGAFFYSQRNALGSLGQPMVGVPVLFDGMSLAILSVIGLLGLGLAVIRLGYKRVVTAAYFERAPRFLNATIQAREKLGLQHYLDRAEKVVYLAIKLYPVFVLYLMVCLTLSHSSYFYVSQLSVVLGVGSVIFWLTYPDVLANLRLYFLFANADKWNPRFPLYREFFASIGKPIPADMRGAGLRWIIRYFGRIAPFESAYYVLCLVLLVMVSALNSFEPREVGEVLSVFVLSVSPVAVAEFTRAPQAGRFYFPGFTGMLLLIAQVAFQMNQLSSWGRLAFWSLSICVVLLSMGWNTWVFFDDVWPARMAPAWLDQKLSRLRIKKFYTYDTPYNDALIDALRPESRERYQIEFVKGLNEVKEGYVVVPGTSAKAYNMEGQRYAIEHGDFTVDPLLNRLLESKAITRYAVASFKTFGTSRIWVHESEVMSYRDLILREISERDRWRGLAWILDAGRLHSDGCLDSVAGEVTAEVDERLA